MNKAQELPIYRNSYCLTQEVMTYTAKFPKDYKFTLGNRLNEDCVNLTALLLEVTYTDNIEELLKTYIKLLNRIRLQLRLCSDFKLLSHGQQSSLICRLECLISQSMAWYRKERRKNRNTLSSNCQS